MPTLAKRLISMGLLLAALQAGCAVTQDDIAVALANSARSVADRERDGRDKPQQVLEFAGFSNGMTIADIFGGGGYYSEILSAVVGPEGRVLLINNAAYDDYAKEELAERLADKRLPNVDYRLVPNDALGLGSNSLDGALIIMTYHDLFYDDPENGWPDVGHEQFMKQVVAALKPGGRLLVTDHAAKDGAGRSETKTLHRIDERFAISELKALGLIWVGSIPALRNPNDDRSRSAFDPAIRGKTDRFVHIYEKQ